MLGPREIDQIPHDQGDTFDRFKGTVHSYYHLIRLFN